MKEKQDRTPNDHKRICEITRELNTVSRRLSALVKNEFPQRMEQLEKDLIFLLKSPALKSFVYLQHQRIDVISHMWKEINGKPNFQEHDGTDATGYLKWRIRVLKHNSSRYYWLDTNAELEPTIDDIFEPEIALRGINGIWTRNVIEEYINERGDRETRITLRKFSVREILIDVVRLHMKYRKEIDDGTLPWIISRTDDEPLKINEIERNLRLFKRKLEVMQRNSRVEHLQMTTTEIKKLEDEGFVVVNTLEPEFCPFYPWKPRGGRAS